MNINIRDVPRSRDDEVLRWVRIRSAGVSAYAIAKRFSVNAGQVVNTTNKVKECDELESGEDTSSAYW